MLAKGVRVIIDITMNKRSIMADCPENTLFFLAIILLSSLKKACVLQHDEVNAKRNYQQYQTYCRAISDIACSHPRRYRYPIMVSPAPPGERFPLNNIKLSRNIANPP